MPSLPLFYKLPYIYSLQIISSGQSILPVRNANTVIHKLIRDLPTNSMMELNLFWSHQRPHGQPQAHCFHTLPHQNPLIAMPLVSSNLNFIQISLIKLLKTQCSFVYFCNTLNLFDSNRKDIRNMLRTSNCYMYK